MSWVITGRQVDAADADARAYLAAVEAADTQTLEPAVRLAVDAFVVGCKADGIWNAIKASCILAGARTLAGALVPLVGTAPTNVGGLFVSGDYNRKTGLVGDGSTKYLDSNRNNNADPQNNHHLGAFASSIQSNIALGTRQGGVGNGGRFVALNIFRDVPSTDTFQSFGSALAGDSTFYGTSRSSSSQYVARIGGAGSTIASTSTTPVSGNLFVFAQNSMGVGPQSHTASRFAFYSIGESLDLALLDARVTTLINAFAAAIP
jgi:hypothetical protein